MNESSENVNDFDRNPSGNEAAGRNDGTPSIADWRELARRVQYETDPQKLSALVQQLITAIDREKSPQLPIRASDEPETPRP